MCDCAQLNGRIGDRSCKARSSINVHTLFLFALLSRVAAFALKRFYIERERTRPEKSYINSVSAKLPHCQALKSSFRHVQLENNK